MAEYLKKINRSSVVQRVIDRLTEAIVSGEFKPGDRIPTEMELAEQMGLGQESRTDLIINANLIMQMLDDLRSEWGVRYPMD